jgi:hypothetical protein
LVGCGGGGSTAPETYTLPTEAPALTAAAGGVTSLSLSWQPVPGAESYAVYIAAAQGVAPSTYASLPEGRLLTGFTGTEATVQGLTRGASYWCVVAARSAYGEGPVSNSVVVVLPPDVVTPVVSLPGHERVVIEWGTARGAAIYDVYLATDPGITSGGWQGLPGGRSLVGVYPPLEVTGLTDGQEVYAVVVARNASGAGPDSAVASCVPTARGAFEEIEVASAGFAPEESIVADLDQDGLLDLIVADTTGDGIHVLRGQGDGTFAPPVSFPVGEGPRAIALGDANADGWLDIASANALDDTVSVLLADGMGGFHPADTYAVGKDPSALAFVELRSGSGWLDLVVACTTDAELFVLPALGGGDFDLPDAFGTGAGPAKVLVGDFDVDGHQDVLTLDTAAASISCFLGDGVGGLLPPLASPAGVAPTSFVAVDLDGNAVPDLLVTDALGADALPLQGSGAGTFAPLAPVQTVPHPAVTLLADVDGDGHDDLIVLRAGVGRIRVMLGDGAGGFLPLADIAPGGGLTSIVLGDFDRDGVLDIAVCEPTTGVVRILRGVSPA